MPTPFTAGAVTPALRYDAAAPIGTTVVLAHGAGAGQGHPFMVAVATALSARGLDVVTFDFPYVHAGRRVPDKAPVLEACFRDVIDAVTTAGAAARPQVVIGGKSMGGRIATHLGAGRLPDGVRGIVALGYPLHPPGRPERPRTAHLPAIAVPLLVVQGERDAFGGPGELRLAFATMAAPVTLHVVPGGDHSFARPGRRQIGLDDDALSAIAAWIGRLDGPG